LGKQSHYELKHFHIYHNLRIPNYYHKRHMFLHNQYMIHYHIQGSQNTVQKQNIQIGNLTGQVKDNKWDYFNGSPIHYTSSQRSVYKQNIMTLNENTDLFSAHFNLDQSNSNGAVVFNNETYILNSISKSDFLNITNWDKTWLQHYDAFYAAKDKMVSVAVNRYKQIIVLSIKSNNERTDIAYYPSRFLACKKISLMQQLVKTALVAGVQSYTSYSTYRGQGTIQGRYNNFGYTETGVTRYYSWAGDRASDALRTVFSGNASMANLNNAWQNLNCW
jgi:hypothetical protein